MTDTFIYEAVNIFTGQPIASFLMRVDAVDFLALINAKCDKETYRLNPVHISDKPFPATLTR